ncbi:DNA-methyltransferase [Cupriavidus plantarum]|uniref:Methyltransferase n=1 Tax=Cupriavidus plantarum TaxID=942865 RepID=A0A316EZ57_9BURK|nr:site-specific DNA-methyltransferase (adenine-specific) [Cupriavidus plantarum]PWK36728.1 site-specific DNA-methyltransferase (adenine-specific) [Cupriavidus plantarum]REF02536.1 site-specific DNA-methyltransferase (adenine-specific) [Cupriavidus plantarum]RLK44613.1 site-specific DNA-methyltransferase (adenine-specific) [Cupriavidus plantarum]CAG2150956.1 Modification methylase RsrI [Cupriavidus plantarum]
MQAADPTVDVLDTPNLRLYQEDMLEGLARIPDGSIDLVVADPPYGLGKDYGNDSDLLSGQAYLDWSVRWMDALIPKIAPRGSLYLFCTWQYSPELFVMLKQRMTMINEIIWDRRVPSMGGTTRKYSSVHDNIGFFARQRDYYFDLDPVRIPYDAETKKARSRPRFEGKKWLEVGYNPKDLWSVPRIHRQDPERADHPTQKPLEIVERMVLASCPPGGIVLDPFSGSGTTAVACLRHGRRFVGFEINATYIDVARQRVTATQPALAEIADSAETASAAADAAQGAQADASNTTDAANDDVASASGTLI